MKRSRKGISKISGNIKQSALSNAKSVHWIKNKQLHTLVKFKYKRLTVINKVSTKLGYYLFCHTQIRHRHYQTMFCVIK